MKAPLRQTWRWFGPDDPTPITALPQAGVEGVVTALHHIPPGTAWPLAEIEARQAQIAQAGLAWEVVESVPVSEAIKAQTAECAAHIAAYKDSLRALCRAGIRTVCYNFMPVLDWTRTSLGTPQPHGGEAMAFDLTAFAAFDLHILARPAAVDAYDEGLSAQAARLFQDLDDGARARLRDTVVAGLPGANDSWSLDDTRAALAAYDNLDAARLRGHLIDFLGEVAPVAQELGMRLCCHPDDPPFALLGLPRVMSSTQGYAAALDAVDLAANGATLCTGSLGVAADFDPVAFVARLGARIHFVHLRNTKRVGGEPDRPSFFEAEHLAGDTDMVATLRALMDEQAQRQASGRADWQIPMRPDHGQAILTDLNGPYLPGYPLIGRTRGLAELRGVMAALAVEGA
ncbi:MAG: mannonate dehydratase [Pseudomonadota bacterium]